MTASLDLDLVRSHFPALALDDWAYLDNAGGSQVLGVVARRVADYMLTTSVQTGASYPASVRASERLAEARRRIGTLINAPRPEEVVLGPSTTVLMRFLATAMATQFKPGDEIVVTDFDHESNIGPWLMLRDQGVVIRTWHADAETGESNLADLDALLNPRTRLVCVTHASNILGAINPIPAIAEKVHAAGARLCVDAVAYAPHRAVDVAALGADYYVFSFYKVYGPHFAVLWGRHDHLLELDGLYHYFYGKSVVPGKLEPGNTNYELAWGSAGIVDYLEDIGAAAGRDGVVKAFDKIAAHEEQLSARVLDWLNARNDVRIIGPRTADRAVRVPTIAFKVDGRRSDDIVRAVEPDHIGIRFGDFHSRRLIERMNLQNDGGVVRVSMVHYNTLDEADRLLAALDKAI